LRLGPSFEVAFSKSRIIVVVLLVLCTLQNWSDVSKDHNISEDVPDGIRGEDVLTDETPHLD